MPPLGCFKTIFNARILCTNHCPGRLGLHTSSAPRRNVKVVTPPSAANVDNATPREKEPVGPQPLTRAIGLKYPPEPGQHTGIDLRPWRQRRDDFFNYDKHLERRKELTAQMAKPYFREWKQMQQEEGKSFIAPRTLFRRERAQYFANLHGRTLESPVAADTTPVLQAHVSIVSVFSGTWAERQTATFWENQSVVEALEQARDISQRVDINVEEDWLKANLVRLFLPSLRRREPQERHGRYFLVRRGLDDSLRQDLAIANSKVGYVYLVDGTCRIRWAASGNAIEGEPEALAAGVRKLAAEHKLLEGAKKVAGKPSVADPIGRMTAVLG
ncbi:MAG: hypothetical protein M1825_004238 [Sarcosagium campestre]|nr:MAG: hypothetical protein M1825_004238 [Sarcosagium campestre]